MESTLSFQKNGGQNIRKVYFFVSCPTYKTALVIGMEQDI